MRCKYCGNDHPEEFFPVALTTPKKVYRRKKCNNCYIATKRALRKKIREEINAYKAEHGCSRCGIKDYRVLDFHHKDSGKEFCVSEWTSCGSRGKAFEEIAKCILLCANCHRILHWKDTQDVV